MAEETGRMTRLIAELDAIQASVDAARDLLWDGVMKRPTSQFTPLLLEAIAILDNVIVMLLVERVIAVSYDNAPDEGAQR